MQKAQTETAESGMRPNVEFSGEGKRSLTDSAGTQG